MELRGPACVDSTLCEIASGFALAGPYRLNDEIAVSAHGLVPVADYFGSACRRAWAPVPAGVDADWRVHFAPEYLSA